MGNQQVSLEQRKPQRLVSPKNLGIGIKQSRSGVPRNMRVKI